MIYLFFMTFYKVQSYINSYTKYWWIFENVKNINKLKSANNKWTLTTTTLDVISLIHY